MIDFYPICDECGDMIEDDYPVKGIIGGNYVQFCCWRCFHRYEADQSYQVEVMK